MFFDGRCMPDTPAGSGEAPDVTMPSLPVTIPAGQGGDHVPNSIPPVTIPDAPGAAPVGH